VILVRIEDLHIDHSCKLLIPQLCEIADILRPLIIDQKFPPNRAHPVSDLLQQMMAEFHLTTHRLMREAATT
jgi:hypothetical protein